MTFPLLADVDDATYALILELQEQDVQELQLDSKGKSREGQLNDAELALSILNEDLRNVSTTLADHRMTRSLAHAIHLDRHILRQTATDDEIARRDRSFARQLSGADAEAQCPPSQPDSCAVDEQMLSKLAAMFVSQDLGEELYWDTRDGEQSKTEHVEGSTADQSILAQRSKPRNGPPVQQCTACRDEHKFFDILVVPCGHAYCRDCLVNLFQGSLTDESLFPPRCCRQRIPMEMACIFFSKELKDHFKEKAIEFGCLNRLYCSQQTCSRFIPPENVHGDVATCASCDSTTCVHCKGAVHVGDCPEDPGMQAVLEAAREHGWQRCTSCGSIVELEQGCNHMTCRCGNQFCYVCGAGWVPRACDHPQWDEARLLGRAELIVARNHVNQVPQPAPARAREIREAAAALLERHECNHTTWRHVTGGHQCEECRQHLPQYIFECRQCRIRACNRCRRNRL